MKELSSILLILIVCPFALKSQDIRIKISDWKSKIPLEFVYILNQKSGHLLSETGEEGIAIFSSKSDSISISLIKMGYERIDTIVVNRDALISFEMKETLTNLNTYTITASRLKKTKKEKYPLERKKSRVWKEIGKHMNGDLLLPRKNEKYPEVYLSEISLKLGNWGKDKTINTRPFRVRFFENKDGYPGQEIGEYNFIPERKKKFRMNFQKYGIKIPDTGIFMFLQMVVGENSFLRVEQRKGAKGRWTKVAKEGAKFRLDNKALKINMGYKVIRYKSD